MATTAAKTKKPVAKKAALSAQAGPKKASAKASPDTFAVIQTGGKQYVVSVGDSVTIEKFVGEYQKGDSVTFDQVLLKESAGSTTIGTPTIAGASVIGEIVTIGRLPKVVVIRYKQKSRYMKKNGHRQPFFKVKITAIK